MTSVNMSGNNRNGNILAENKKISDDFIGLVSSMFETIDEVSEKIGDGKYLELANQFKTLMEFKNKMTTNIVYIEHERRTRMRVMENKRRLTLAEKLADKKKYMKCWKCDTVITKKEIGDHQLRRKCRHIHSSRMITLATKMRVSKEGLIILEDTLNERTGYYWINNFDGEKEKGEKIFTVRDYYENQINHEKQSATKIQALYRGYKVRKNMKKKECLSVDRQIYTIKELRNNIRLKKSYKKESRKKWELYRQLKKYPTPKKFNSWRLLICKMYELRVKGVSKMTRLEIEMEIARRLWCK